MIDNNEAERYIIVVVTTIVTNQQECRGRNPLPGFEEWQKPILENPLFAAVGNECNRSAEDAVLCRGSGCPRKPLLPLLPP